MLHRPPRSDIAGKYFSDVRVDALPEPKRARGRLCRARETRAVYELPPAEYNYVGQATRDQVLEKAKRAARAVKPSFAVVVTEANGVTWYGLKLVKKAAA